MKLVAKALKESANLDNYEVPKCLPARTDIRLRRISCDAFTQSCQTQLAIFDDVSTDYGQKELQSWFGDGAVVKRNGENLGPDRNIAQSYFGFLRSDCDSMLNLGAYNMAKHTRMQSDTIRAHTYLSLMMLAQTPTSSSQNIGFPVSGPHHANCVRAGATLWQF